MEFVGFILRGLVVMSIVLSLILKYQNWSFMDPILLTFGKNRNVIACDGSRLLSIKTASLDMITTFFYHKSNR